MNRREFLGVLMSPVVGASGVAHAQTGDVKRVGILMGARLSPLETFRHALRELGRRNGENIRFEERFAEGSAA